MRRLPFWMDAATRWPMARLRRTEPRPSPCQMQATTKRQAEMPNGVFWSLIRANPSQAWLALMLICRTTACINRPLGSNVWKCSKSISSWPAIPEPGICATDSAGDSFNPKREHGMTRFSPPFTSLKSRQDSPFSPPLKDCHRGLPPFPAKPWAPKTGSLD